jgi:hypothetical protein
MGRIDGYFLFFNNLQKEGIHLGFPKNFEFYNFMKFNKGYFPKEKFLSELAKYHINIPKERRYVIEVINGIERRYDVCEKEVEINGNKYYNINRLDIPPFLEITSEMLSNESYILISYFWTLYENEPVINIILPLKFSWENLITYETIEPKVQVLNKRIIFPKSLERLLQEQKRKLNGFVCIVEKYDYKGIRVFAEY